MGGEAVARRSGALRGIAAAFRAAAQFRIDTSNGHAAIMMIGTVTLEAIDRARRPVVMRPVLLEHGAGDSSVSRTVLMIVGVDAVVVLVMRCPCISAIAQSTTSR